MKMASPLESSSCETAVQVTAASKKYPNGTQALLPVTLSIKQGEFVSLLGPSGCGKSTLLKMIAGLTAPTNGSIDLWHRQTRNLNHENTTQPEINKSAPRLSFVFQSPTLMPWATVRANTRLPLDLAGVSKDEGNSRVDKVLQSVGLFDFADYLPRALSGGMQMRVSIARGLVTEPSILLMDEPFGALDEITRNKLDADLLMLWQKKNLTIIFVTHSIHEAVYLSSKVIMMAARPGRITEEIVIDQPYPRNPEFMVTSEFARYAGLLQRSLLNASQTN